MFVLGIVGSPRKDGRTNNLIDSALEGVKSRGVETRKIFLTDYEIRPFRGTGGSQEAYKYCPPELSRLCDESDAIILGAPVYWGDINGLTKDFMDSVQMPNCRDKPGLGIAIAGGTGKGLLSGVQSIYHFFFHKQMRAIDPTPVSRFNLQETLDSLRTSGARLADLARAKSPPPSKMADEYWPEITAYYASLNYLACDPVDEFLMLAEQLVKSSKGGRVEEARAELDKAIASADEGKRSEAARHAVKSYQILYFPP